MESQKRINLIYIASIGRSGSTLLESMLGAHSQMATMGELHLWPHELMQGGVRPCSCGAYVQTCPFWVEMRRRIDPLKQETAGIHFFREKHNAGRTLRLKYLKGFEAIDTALLREREAISAYGENSCAVFEAFLDVSETLLGTRPRWIVDASKDPYRLLWLLRSGLFNVKVLHLVKNPRAFVYSVTKQFLGPQRSLATAKRWYYAARQSAAWSMQNYLFSKIAQNHLPPSDYLLIHYEALATASKATFAQVCECIGCDFEAGAIERFRSGSLHTIAGNPMRYENRPIQLDEKWKKHLPASSRRIAELVTKVNRSYYGYC